MNTAKAPAVEEGARSLRSSLARYRSLVAVLTSPAPSSTAAPLSPAPHSTAPRTSPASSVALRFGRLTPSRVRLAAYRPLVGTRHRTLIYKRSSPSRSGRRIAWSLSGVQTNSPSPL